MLIAARKIAIPEKGLIAPETFDHVKAVGTHSVTIAGHKIDVNFAKLVQNATKLATAKAKSFTISALTSLPRAMSLAEKGAFLPTLGIENLEPSSNWPYPSIHNGILVLLGDTEAGKTYTIANKLKPQLVIRVDEPAEDIDTLENTIPASSFIHALELALTLSLVGYHCAIDGGRALMKASGAAMEGGVSAELFSDLTLVNNMFANIGRNVVITLNPMLADTEKADRLATRIAASTAGVMHIVKRRMVLITARVEGDRISSESNPDLLVPYNNGDTGPVFEGKEGGTHMAFINHTRLTGPELKMQDFVDADDDENPRPRSTPSISAL